jgi:cytochrome P450 family 142 subfamily A polypeptide 1
MIVIGDMLGVPPEDRDQLLRWSDDLIGSISGDPDRIVAAAAAFSEYEAYARRTIAARREEPTDDLVSVLVRAEVDGDRLDDDELLFESLLILVGGDETTRHVISGGMLALMEHPDQRALLTGGADIETGVEELLRWITPIKNMSRTAARDVEFGGQQLREGDQLMLFYPSANRDEAVFDDPYRFDVTRDPNPHIAFGFGPHFCLGAALARIELKVMFSELLRRLPDIELDTTEPLPYRASNFIVGPEAMPVRFTPAPAT